LLFSFSAYTIKKECERYNGRKNLNQHTMATLTISYDGRNRTARSVVELIRSLNDVFQVTAEQPKETDREWTAAEEREAFLCTSRMNMARWMAENKI